MRHGDQHMNTSPERWSRPDMTGTATTKILIVDDRPENLFALQRLLGQLDVQVLQASSGNEALALTLEHDFCLAIVDVQMPEMDGYELVELLRGNPTTATLPVIFVSAVFSDDYHHRKAYESGAVDFMSKPFIPEIMLSKVKVFIELYHQRLKLVENVKQLSVLNTRVMQLNTGLEEMVRQRTLELEQRSTELQTTRYEVIRQLGRAAEVRDKETGQHVERVSQYVRLLALAAGLDAETAELYYTVAPLHDIGKIGIPDQILRKPGPLDVDEMRTMRLHAEIGAQIIGEHPSELMRTARLGCLYHHERWNGQGYPHRLAKEDIPLVGRLLALADVFDAVTSPRPYKDAWPLEEAFELVRNEVGEHFDPYFADLFLRQKASVIEIYHDHQD